MTYNDVELFYHSRFALYNLRNKHFSFNNDSMAILIKTMIQES